jgi:hypothetical protein
MVAGKPVDRSVDPPSRTRRTVTSLLVAFGACLVLAASAAGSTVGIAVAVAGEGVAAAAQDAGGPDVEAQQLRAGRTQPTDRVIAERDAEPGAMSAAPVASCGRPVLAGSLAHRGPPPSRGPPAALLS